MAKQLFKISSNGSVQLWQIEGSVAKGEVLITYGQQGGALQTQIDKIEVNNSGRGMKEQMLLEMRSRISRQKDKGYRDTVQEAREFLNMNALNLPRPMLAQRYDQVTGIDEDKCYRQIKYDGHRMLVHNTGDGLIAYTRNGKVIDTLDHILEGLHIPEGGTLDGEVYHHGVPLQTIASWCKRKQAETLKLSYVVYDFVSPLPFGERFGGLIEFSRQWNEFAKLAPTWKDPNRTAVEDLVESRAQGYEGIMLRENNSGYEAGKRSRSLIKVKHALDAEFWVVDIVPSKDGWGVLVCKTDKGKEFRVSAPGTMDVKKRILETKHYYIGKKVNVQYFSITNEGIPFHPVATSFM